MFYWQDIAQMGERAWDGHCFESILEHICLHDEMQPD